MLKNTLKQSQIGKQLSVPKIERKSQVTVKISEDFINKVTLLNSRISQVEWSGVLFYSAYGSISHPENLQIELRDILLMDIGTSAFTSYEFNADVVDYIEADPQRFEWKIGHIHSHNTMKTYFSGTDMEELIENSENYDYYLSIIVNNNLDIVGKIAYRGISEGLNYIYSDEAGNRITKMLTRKTEYVFIHNCDIEESRNPISNRIDDLIVEKQKAQALKQKSSKKVQTYSLWDDQPGWEQYKGQKGFDFENNLIDKHFDEYNFDATDFADFQVYDDTIEMFCCYLLDENSLSLEDNRSFKEVLSSILPQIAYLTDYNFQLHYEEKFVDFYRGLEPNCEVGLIIIKELVNLLQNTKVESKAAFNDTEMYKAEFIKLLKNLFYEY